MKQFFTYNPKTGDFRWTERPRSHFKTAAAWKTWNTKFAGEPAGTVIKGRTQVLFKYKVYQASRIIYEIMTGKKPDKNARCKARDLKWANLSSAFSVREKPQKKSRQKSSLNTSRNSTRAVARSTTRRKVSRG